MTNNWPAFIASTKRRPSAGEIKFARNVLANTQALMLRNGITYEAAFARITNGLSLSKYLTARFLCFDAIAKRDWTSISRRDIATAKDHRPKARRSRRYDMERDQPRRPRLDAAQGAGENRRRSRSAVEHAGGGDPQEPAAHQQTRFSRVLCDSTHRREELMPQRQRAERVWGGDEAEELERELVSICNHLLKRPENRRGPFVMLDDQLRNVLLTLRHTRQVLAPRHFTGPDPTRGQDTATSADEALARANNPRRPHSGDRQMAEPSVTISLRCAKVLMIIADWLPAAARSGASSAREELRAAIDKAKAERAADDYSDMR